jgi:hypothetical protein
LEERRQQLEALRILAQQKKEALESPDNLQEGRKAEEQESQFLESRALKQAKREFKYTLTKDLLDGVLKLFWILFSLVLISYLFLFGWYVILCLGVKKLIYVNFWPVWHVTFEVSKIPFEGLKSEIVTTYLTTAIVQTFLFIGALQKLVIKEETWLDNVVKYIKQFGQYWNSKNNKS